MNHLFLGINPEYSGLSPKCRLMSLSGIQARELGLPVYPEAELIIAPNVGSYVGGDILQAPFFMMWNSGDFSPFY